MKLIISGGGARLSYLLGIKKYIEESNIIIDEYAGSSSGALFAVLMACKLKNEYIIKVYLRLIKDDIYKNNYKFKIIKKFLKIVLPKNCHELCSGKVRISISVSKFPLLKNQIINKFISRDHLIDIILSSCSFPFFINKNFFHKLSSTNSKGISLVDKQIYATDGLFTNNTPLIEKNNSKNQIIIKTYVRSIYDLDLFIYKKISNYMMRQGYNEMKKFIENGESIYNFTISHNQYNTKIFVMYLIIYIIISPILKNLINHYIKTNY
tara:strand:+ start:97 stop:894 length:798 start_codon:yes stop_codon:yes gene_type:complete